MENINKKSNVIMNARRTLSIFELLIISRNLDLREIKTNLHDMHTPGFDIIMSKTRAINYISSDIRIKNTLKSIKKDYDCAFLKLDYPNELLNVKQCDNLHRFVRESYERYNTNLKKFYREINPEYDFENSDWRDDDIESAVEFFFKVIVPVSDTGNENLEQIELVNSLRKFEDELRQLLLRYEVIDESEYKTLYRQPQNSNHLIETDSPKQKNGIKWNDAKGDANPYDITKTDLYELIFALIESKSIVGYKTQKEVYNEFGEFFGLDLSKYSHRKNDLFRRNEPTIFLDKLIKAIEKQKELDIQKQFKKEK